MITNEIDLFPGAEAHYYEHAGGSNAVSAIELVLPSSSLEGVVGHLLESREAVLDLCQHILAFFVGKILRHIEWETVDDVDGIAQRLEDRWFKIISLWLT